MATWRPSMHESSGSLSSSPRSIAQASTAKAAPTASPIFLSRLLEPAAEHNRSCLTSFNTVGLPSPNPVGDSGIYLLRTRGLRAPPSPIPGVGSGGLAPLAKSTVLGGLVPHTESTALGGLEPLAESTVLGGLVPHNERSALGGLEPLAKSTVLGGLVPRNEHVALGRLPVTSTGFRDYRTHESRKELTAFELPRGHSLLVFLPPSPLPKAVPARGRSRLPLTTFSLLFLPYLSRAARALQKTRLQRRPTHSRLIYPGVLHRRRPSPRPPVGLCPSPPCLSFHPLRRQRRADE